MASDADLRWLRGEIGSGLQRLYVLRLSGGPFTDQELLAMAEVWFEAIVDHPVAWDEGRDRKRVAHAFRSLIKNSDRWPAPKAFFDNLGMRPPLPLKQIGRQTLTAKELQQREEGKARLQEIANRYAPKE